MTLLRGLKRFTILTFRKIWAELVFEYCEITSAKFTQKGTWNQTRRMSTETTYSTYNYNDVWVGGTSPGPGHLYMLDWPVHPSNPFEYHNGEPLESAEYQHTVNTFYAKE